MPNITNDAALEIQAQACEEVGDELGIEIRPSLDMAASELWNADEQKYIYAQDGIKRDTGDQIDFVKDIIDTYNMFYVEDPFDESDFDGFAQLTSKVGDKCLICGDDLFVTNKEILAKGIEMNAANAIIIKPNQIGSLSETYATVKLAKENDIIPVVSHRSCLLYTSPDDVTEDLTFPEFIPQRTSQIDPNKSLFKQLDKKDILLFYPYQTMDHFIDFLKEAANDPEVLSIKITLYRVARTSSVIKYLLEALDNDKRCV